MDVISAIKGVTAVKALTPEQEAQVKKLAARDREVRAHEAAHLAAAGILGSGVEYTYELGPDGRLYAVAGKVRISIPAGLSPEQRLAAARELLQAAQAPGNPSGQDMIVAAKASQMEAEALQKIAEERAQSESPRTDAAARELDRFA